MSPTRSRFRLGPGFGLAQVIGSASVPRLEVERCANNDIHPMSVITPFLKIRELLRQMGSGPVVTK